MGSFKTVAPTTGLFYYAGSPGGDGCATTGEWGPFWEFHVNLHVQDANDPTDSVGSATVDLASGGLSYTEQAPSFTTPGGPVGFSFTYNSRAETNFGLTTAVYQNPGDSGTVLLPARGEPGAGGAMERHRARPRLPGVPQLRTLGAGWSVVSYTGLLALPGGELGTPAFCQRRERIV